MKQLSKTVDITLAGVPRVMHFDMNAFDAFETSCGSFFLNFYVEIQEAMQLGKKLGDRLKAEAPALDETADDYETKSKELTNDIDRQVTNEIMKKISLRNLKALIWATIIEYDRNDKPRWPLTLEQVGHQIRLEDLGGLLSAVVKGFTANRPDDSQVTEPVRPTSEGQSPILISGGVGSGPSADDLLASLEPKRVA